MMRDKTDYCFFHFFIDINTRIPRNSHETLGLGLVFYDVVGGIMVAIVIRIVW
jgi:hypothetical protein